MSRDAGPQGERTKLSAKTLIDIELKRLDRGTGGSHLIRYLGEGGARQSAKGARFEHEVDRVHDHITERDIRALKLLSMHIPAAWAERLTNQQMSDELAEVLSQVDRNRRLEDIDEDEFDGVLGSNAPADRAWHLLHMQLTGAGPRVGRWVTPGKLLYGKRPQLLPIFDNEVGKALRVTVHNCWELTWNAVRDPEIREGLEQLRSKVPAAKDRSLIRILDIVGWGSRIYGP